MIGNVYRSVNPGDFMVVDSIDDDRIDFLVIESGSRGIMETAGLREATAPGDLQLLGKLTDLVHCQKCGADVQLVRGLPDVHGVVDVGVACATPTCDWFDELD